MSYRGEQRWQNIIHTNVNIVEETWNWTTVIISLADVRTTILYVIAVAVAE